MWLWAGMLSMPGCRSEFFVDNGHIDHVDGVAFQIQPPHLFIKKAFHLRDQVLSPWQLQQLAEAMPAIAALTYDVLVSPQPLHTVQVQTGHIGHIRSVRALLKLDDATPLFVRALQHWKIQEGTIEWTTDYFWTNAQGERETFRDNYAVRKNAQAWLFTGHPLPAPEGRLRCLKNQSGWVKCG